ncbi:hypothetical protein, partial [Azospirillum isscasi]
MFYELSISYDERPASFSIKGEYGKRRRIVPTLSKGRSQPRWAAPNRQSHKKNRPGEGHPPDRRFSDRFRSQADEGDVVLVAHGAGGDGHRAHRLAGE